MDLKLLVVFVGLICVGQSFPHFKRRRPPPPLWENIEDINDGSAGPSRPPPENSGEVQCVMEEDLESNPDLSRRNLPICRPRRPEGDADCVRPGDLDFGEKRRRNLPICGAPGEEITDEDMLNELEGALRRALNEGEGGRQGGRRRPPGGSRKKPSQEAESGQRPPQESGSEERPFQESGSGQRPPQGSESGEQRPQGSGGDNENMLEDLEQVLEDTLEAMQNDRDGKPIGDKERPEGEPSGPPPEPTGPPSGPPPEPTGSPSGPPPEPTGSPSGPPPEPTGPPSERQSKEKRNKIRRVLLKALETLYR